ncbi:hypothetical protein GCM10009841_20750 [Microlunatus panaciterrae]|uniref:Nitroimidazol reductase NimA-like FMN-containing flavoprotein (Pyridoxamine 5'-phosphate oxidase superfamily) n=1 Tax=Microlunatus panaciterrae TaxID=400768 RepID=A0ABS2RNR1_9ACTN|nr:pyridoxamine 5'-phosphate oxidase family protein [Microlunatus panaciterrae]MBM7800627.1 nitroimidazol reductase NimA-like FMN-containing flavoprotein (pyridoxamine 5'-phosphate oxidase superfamily) [Microlunatus panaciterrae]
MVERHGRLDEMAVEACWDRLRAGIIGRVCWNTVDGPELLPVNYAVHKEHIVFRTSAYGPLADLKDPREVAFEIDEFDPVERSGWSVLVRGKARAVTRPDELIELRSGSGPEPWAAGSRNLVITITPRKVTGRVVAAHST